MMQFLQLILVCLLLTNAFAKESYFWTVSRTIFVYKGLLKRYVARSSNTKDNLVRIAEPLNLAVSTYLEVSSGYWFGNDGSCIYSHNSGLHFGKIGEVTCAKFRFDGMLLRQVEPCIDNNVVCYNGQDEAIVTDSCSAGFIVDNGTVSVHNDPTCGKCPTRKVVRKYWNPQKIALYDGTSLQNLYVDDDHILAGTGTLCSLDKNNQFLYFGKPECVKYDINGNAFKLVPATSGECSKFSYENNAIKLIEPWVKFNILCFSMSNDKKLQTAEICNQFPIVDPSRRIPIDVETDIGANESCNHGEEIADTPKPTSTMKISESKQTPSLTRTATPSATSSAIPTITTSTNNEKTTTTYIEEDTLKATSTTKIRESRHTPSLIRTATPSATSSAILTTTTSTNNEETTTTYIEEDKDGNQKDEIRYGIPMMKSILRTKDVYVSERMLILLNETDLEDCFDECVKRRNCLSFSHSSNNVCVLNNWKHVDGVNPKMDAYSNNEFVFYSR